MLRLLIIHRQIITVLAVSNWPKWINYQNCYLVKKKVCVISVTETLQTRNLSVISADLDMDQVLIIPYKCYFSFRSFQAKMDHR